MSHPELNKLHHGISYEEYALSPGLRAGDLKHLKRSPAHYFAMKGKDIEPSEAQEFGQVFHAAIEHGKDFLERYVVPPIFSGKTKDGRESTQSKEAKLKKAEWYASLPEGSIVVQQDWVEPLKGMLKACLEHRLVGNLLRNGIRETSLWVQDEHTGEILKCRPDFISADGFLVDIKTTRNAHHSEWAGKYGHIFGERGYFYALQMAHYTHCLRLAGLSKGEMATIVAIEKEPPYGVRAYPLDVGALGWADQFRHDLTKLYAECAKTGFWPNYPEEAFPLIVPENVRTPDQEEYQ